MGTTSKCLDGPGRDASPPRFCGSDTVPQSVFILCQSVLNVTLNQGSFNYFQIFLVFSYAMQLMEVQFKRYLCQLISTGNYFSLIAPIKCWLPALCVSQGKDSLSVEYPGSCLLCFAAYDLEVEEKNEGTWRAGEFSDWTLS